MTKHLNLCLPEIYQAETKVSMSKDLIIPMVTPPLDRDFRPAVLQNHAFLDVVRGSSKEEPLGIAIERNDGLVSVYKTIVPSDDRSMKEANFTYVEYLVKALLWQWGGWKIVIGGPKAVGKHVKKEYLGVGKHAFDAEFMGNVYKKPFTVETADFDELPRPKEKKTLLGKHFDGCRIGLDLGASDRKVAAVIDGEAVFSEEVVWNPKTQSDPQYHFNEIMSALRSAASHMPRVDAIGVSAAGIYINNRVMVASLFRGVSRELFESRVKNLFIDIKKEWGGVPLEVIHDGDVAALAGAMSLNETKVLGVALGSSEGVGYIDEKGGITGWLNELAFVPVDSSPSAPVDEWSGDRGCGVQYFSQEAVIRLALKEGMTFIPQQTPAEKLKEVQKLMSKEDKRAKRIFETIGCYMGYGVAYYADFYDISHVLLLGRVVSGEGGNIILEKTKKVLDSEFPALAAKIRIHLPDESNRRVGQAVAAASLPALK